MASGVPMSLPLRRSVSSPCLVDQSRDTFAEIEMPSETTIIDSGPLMSTPPVMPSKKTLRINPVSSKSRPRSHHASTKSFSLRSGPFAKTDFFSLQRAVPNELTSDKRRSCSMGDDLHLGSQQQQVVGVIQPIAATMAPEILSWTFRHLMDRKSILNCGLVCRRWYGPAREELAHLLRDMPYNGQGLIQAIRTRFVSETLSTLSVFVFDKLLWNLAEVYYYSNPDTKAIFAPQYPPDMLYHLFWTFLFVDQEFRNPRTKSKVNSAYYIRLLQGEGCGYPKQHFHKKVFKNIFNDIRAKPLLPSPHLIQSLQALGDGHGGLGGATASSSLFMRFSGSLRIDDSLRRIRRWWRSMREIGSQINSGPALEGSGSSTSTINAMTRVSNFSNGGTCSSQDTSEVLRVSDIDSRLLDPKDLTKSSLSGSHQDSCGSRSTLSSPALHRSSLFNGSGSKSDVSTHHQHHLPFMNDGFTSVGFGWHPDGDGLDGVVKLPFSEKPSRLGDQHQIMKAASFVAEINHYEDVS
ncbi:hypothetical protein BGW41_001913 [Actinomortierella wolfii]|nr:hypothetical protein BGW41_001913 [Actinomortierella wolfii]